MTGTAPPRETTEPVRGESQVLVIGAGPAGAAAAIQLARRGIDVALVDRARFPRDKICGDAVSKGAMSVLEELGVADDVLAGPHATVRRGAAVFPDGTRLTRVYERPSYIVPRLHLDDAIKRGAQAAGARVLEGHAVSRLTLEAGRVTGAEGSTLSWRSPIVIAADGYGSVALGALGRDQPRGRALGLSAAGYFTGVRFPHGRDTSDHIFEHDLHYGYAWIFPDVEARANIGVYIRQDAYKRAGIPLAALMERFLARHPDRFDASERVGKLRVWSLPIATEPAPASAPGLLLAGDAGGFIDPLTGEGIWQALFSGTLAADVASRGLREGGLTAEHLASFEAECQRRLWRPSRTKTASTYAIRMLLRTGLYRRRPVRAALRLAYAGHRLDMTKS